MIQPQLCFFVLAIETGEEYLGVGIIACNLDASDGYQFYARVIDLETHQFGQFTLDLLGDAVCSCKICHDYLKDRASVPSRSSCARRGGQNRPYSKSRNCHELCKGQQLRQNKLQCARNLYDLVDFQFVANLQVVETLH